jgi:hypothetical protein
MFSPNKLTSSKTKSWRVLFKAMNKFVISLNNSLINLISTALFVQLRVVGCEWKWLWPIVRSHPGTFLEGLKKTMGNLSPKWEYSLGPPEHATGMIKITPLCLILSVRKRHYRDHCSKAGRDSSLGIVTRLRAWRPRNHASIPGRRKRSFSSVKRSDRLWGPPSILFIEYRG